MMVCPAIGSGATDSGIDKVAVTFIGIILNAFDHLLWISGHLFLS